MGARLARMLGALMLLSTCFVALPNAATAQTSGGAEVWSRAPGAVSGSVFVLGGTGGSSDGGPSAGGYAAAQIFTQRYNDWRWCTDGYGCGQWDWRCDPDAPTVTIYPFDADGNPKYSETPPTATGDPIRYSVKPITNALDYGDGENHLWCAGPGHPAPVVGAAPTMDEIWRSGSIAGGGPEVHLLPLGHGLTGLNTPLWLTLGVGNVQNLDINIRGWSVHATVWLDRIEWRVADAATDRIVATEGVSRVSGGGVALGSSDDPLQQFRFRTKGTYRVTGTAVWHAEGTISLEPLQITVPVSFPDAGLSTFYDYPVDELVGVLDQQPR